MLVKYYAGTKTGSVGAYEDLHKRGCRVRVFKRPVDVDELYQQRPWMPLSADITWPAHLSLSTYI